MASIRNLKLSIERGGPKGPDAPRKVEVEFILDFPAHEVLSGAVFKETLALKGDDVLNDQLTTLRTQLVKATTATLHRTFSGTVRRSDLDEDSDTLFEDADELFAKVTVEPVPLPQGSVAKSNAVIGSFGAIGND